VRKIDIHGQKRDYRALKEILETMKVEDVKIWVKKDDVG